MGEWQKDMTKLRLYNEKENTSAKLPFQNFTEVLKDLENNNQKFISYYDSGKLVSEHSFSDIYQEASKLTKKIQHFIASHEYHFIAVIADNSPQTIITFSAVLNSGMTLIPLDPGMDKSYYDKISSKFASTLLISNASHISQNSFTHIMDTATKENSEEYSAQSRTASEVIFTSSGTTGAPKGIVQNFQSILINSMATIKVHSLDTSSRHFCLLPLFHVNAFSFSFFTSLINKNELILNRNFSLPTFWDTVAITQPQIISLVPPVLRVLVEDPREHEVSQSLKYVVSAASNLGKKTLIDFYKKFNTPVIQAYGLSETVNFTTTFPTHLSPQEYENILALDEKTSIGTEVWGNNVFILNNENVVIDTEKTEGEIVVRGWNVMKHYYQSENDSQHAFLEDYFHTGDMGYFRNINGEKFYYISGRKKEIAKINGKMIYLNEIDESIMKLDFVSNACSVCYLDENDEEQLGCIISTKTPIDLKRIKADLKTTLHSSISIRKIILNVDILMTASGKKRRSEMAKVFMTKGNK